MPKKSKQNSKEQRQPRNANISTLAPLPAGAKPVDHMAYQIMLNYVNGTGFTDIRTVVDNSYRMADQFIDAFNKRHDIST